MQDPRVSPVCPSGRSTWVKRRVQSSGIKREREKTKVLGEQPVQVLLCCKELKRERREKRNGKMKKRKT